MPTTTYFRWVAAGRPITPARPIREFVWGMRLACPADRFSWYADEAHYQADFPQDHTPYSRTGWPLPCPEWVVFATDVMHHPDLGVDCRELVPYWLTEARAGRMPWLKYIIWQATRYDVRNNWAPVSGSGHYDHAHLSARTDHEHTPLGDWSPTPEDDMTPEQAQMLKDIWYALFASTGPARPAPSLIARVIAIGFDVTTPPPSAPHVHEVPPTGPDTPA